MASRSMWKAAHRISPLLDTGKPRLRLLFIFCWGLLTICLWRVPAARAQDAAASPKKPWGSFDVVEERRPNWLSRTLLWGPNRVLDLLDALRLDVGVGPAFGAVVRLTPKAQAGWRGMAPASYRIGFMGRRSPYLEERGSEFGVSPLYYSYETPRPLCHGEIAIGLDAALLSAYGGFCLIELADFFGGLFFFDLAGDDIR